MFARFFVDRPIFATVLSIVIVMVGLIALAKLPVAQYPEVAPPVISITASYPGANALDVAENVATPIEQQVNGVENMIYMLSKCTNDGQMTLDVTFKPGTDLNMAQVLVQNRVSIAEAKLPDEVKRQGVTTKKKSPSILMCVNLISEKEEKPSPGKEFKFDQLYLSNYATLNIKDVLARIEGVGDVSFLGPRDYSMRVWLDPEKTASVGMTPSEVVQSLREQNRQVPAGRIGQPPIPKGQDFQYPLSTPSRLAHEKDFAEVILKSSGSAIVKLRDVVSTRTVTTNGKAEQAPNIELGAQNYDVNSFLDGQPAVTLAIFQLPGSNALETAGNLKKAMHELSQTFPKGIQYKIVYDTTVFIDESIHEVYKTLFEAFVLVFVVVLVFLQDWRATLLPMIDVPVSLIGTFAIMALMGFSLNNLTLFGLVLAIGIVVDDAIVVVENIERWMAKGLAPREATIHAMDEITGPVISITLVLCSVFVPTVFLAGIAGKFYSQFALTIAVSTVISAINAMTMAPARAVTLIKPHSAEQHHGTREVLPPLGYALLIGFAAFHFLGDQIMGLVGVHPPAAHGEGGGAIASPTWQIWLVRLVVFAAGATIGWLIHKPVNAVFARFLAGFNKVFDVVTNVYGATVTRILRVSVIALVLYAGLLGLTYQMTQIVPTGFIPDQDKGYLVVNAQLPDGASLERTGEVMRTMDEIALHGDQFKESIAHTINLPGYSILTGTNLSNVGGMFVILKPFEERKQHAELSAKVVAAKLRKVFSERILGANVVVFGAPPIDGLGNTGGFKLQVQDRTAQGPRALEGAVLNFGMAGMAQKDKLTGMFSSYSARQPQIIASVDRDHATASGVALHDLYDTLGIYFGSAYVNDFTRFGRNWQVIVQADPMFRREIRDLSTLQVRNNKGSMVSLDAFIKNQSNTGPAIVNRYNMYPSAELNGATMPGTSSGDAIKMMNALAKQELPTGMGSEWTELTYQEIEAGKDPLSPWIFPLSVLFVFMVLAAQYESWSMPFAIILIVPMCVMSAYIGIWLVGLDNNIFTQIGLVVLVAMAAKNAILVVEFAKQSQDQGMDRTKAVIHAGKVRLRPILMTSAAFILGVVPLVLAKGAGAEMRSALGIAVFSGMLGVTFFGIFLTPVFYVTIRWLVERNAAPKASAPAAPGHSQTPAGDGPAQKTGAVQPAH
jgi:multidrug efflux pump